MTMLSFQTFPLDEIEQTVAQANGTKEAIRIVSFPVLKDNATVLGIVAELKSSPCEAEETIGRIRISLRSRYGFEPAFITMVQPGQLPQPTPGACDRQAIRLAVLLGTMNEIKTWVADGIAREHLLCPLPEDIKATEKTRASTFKPNTIKSIERWIRHKIHSEYSIPKQLSEMAQSFNELGLSSISQLQIVRDAEKEMAIKIAPTAIWETGTIKNFSEYIFNTYKGK